MYQKIVSLFRLCSLAILLTFPVLGYSNNAESIDYSKIQQHPRLLMMPGEEKSIQTAVNRSPELERVYKFIISESDKLDITPTLYFKKDGRRLLGVSREALKRIFFTSFAYRMTGNSKYAIRAEQELRAVCSFESWNPTHFLDVGEMTMAVAIGYDWLYDQLSDDTKKMACEAILNKGFIPSKNNQYNAFLNFTSNWNQVCNTGLVYGALSIMEEHPEEAQFIIDRALKTIGKSMASYAPDGNYPEGYNYWGYGTSFNVFLIAALESALGTDAGLSTAPGFMESAKYMLFMAGTTGMQFNYSDSAENGHCLPALFWFASRTGDSSLVSYEKQFLNNPSSRFTFEETRFLPLILIYGKNLDLKNLPDPSSKIWTGNGVTPVAMVRTDWRFGKGCYLGMKGGSASNSHSHMDGGSFVFEANGVRWAKDLGSDNYGRLESNKVDLWNRSQEGQRWDLFRYNNWAHNTLTINEKKHLVKGNVTIRKVYDQKNRLGAVMDMTSLFADDIQKVERECIVVNEQYLQVSDRIRTGKEQADVRWTMVTSAEAKIENDHVVELSKDGKKLQVVIDSPRDGKFEILDNKPEMAYESKNPGTCRLVFHSLVPKNSRRTIKVRLVPLD